MESDLIATLDQIASREDVKGVLLADEMGLCLGVCLTCNSTRHCKERCSCKRSSDCTNSS
ncbi:hypothetical protein BDB00DRAFT_167423 [Zychaea mexicana]|uniref:uncharacterized protein n=1 Tax=Zychaea mexicana TaxID=64656 RepID=UPI0022FEBFE3|nr:uncharacterized protein BDB00DRAFT_167423 [Zychaea mexicana]KAI9482546.1 hypothetical protein BDB00DRAFT_167423 [Zychaea mexicana]